MNILRVKCRFFQAVPGTLVFLRLATVGMTAEATKERIQVIQTSPSGTETRIDVRFALRPQEDIPAGITTFGGGHGQDRKHRAITSFSVRFFGRQLPPLPVRSFNDLLNPTLLEGPSWFPKHDTFEMHFPGGSGEKYYEVTFTWDPESHVLSRMVERPVFGRWTSKWRLKGNQWRALSLGVHEPEEE